MPPLQPHHQSKSQHFRSTICWEGRLTDQKQWVDQDSFLGKCLHHGKSTWNLQNWCTGNLFFFESKPFEDFNSLSGEFTEDSPRSCPHHHSNSQSFKTQKLPRECQTVEIIWITSVVNWHWLTYFFVKSIVSYPKMIWGATDDAVGGKRWTKY